LASLCTTKLQHVGANEDKRALFRRRARKGTPKFGGEGGRTAAGNLRVWKGVHVIVVFIVSVVVARAQIILFPLPSPIVALLLLLLCPTVIPLFVQRPMQLCELEHAWWLGRLVTL